MAQDTSYGSYWALTFTNTASSSSCTYKFDQDGDWDPQWGSGTGSQNASPNSTMGQVRGSISGESPGNMTATFTMGSVLTFRLAGSSTWWDRQYLVMETAQWPAAITSVAYNASAAGTNAVAVTISLDRTKSTQETVYVRYSTNAWTSASLVTATGTTATMTAQIPGQANGKTVHFYVLSSTMPLSLVMTNTDFCTLRGNSHNGSNYTYIVQALAPNPPTNLGTGDVAETSFTASWTASEGATNYLIDVCQGVGNDFYQMVAGYTNRSLGNVTSAGVTGLQSGTMTYFRLRAQNAVGTSSNSATQSVRTQDHVDNPGNCWHIPANGEPSGVTMRNPLNPSASQSVYFYNGVYAGDSDQSGGCLKYRLSTVTDWTSVPLGFDQQAGDNKYWYTNIPSGTFTGGDTVEYYFEVTFTDHDTTYIATTNGGNSCVTYVSETSAQANPFSFTYTNLFGNCWHFPTNQEPGTATMRNPVTPDAADTVYIYDGNYQVDGDQTGGWLFYREAGAGNWSSNALAYDTSLGSNNYWKTTIAGATYTNGAVIEYILCVEYANNPALSATWLGTTDGADNVKYASRTAAETHTFSFTYAAAPANLGNCWHVPGNYEPQGAFMRNPRNPYADNAVYCYNGNQFQGAGNPGDQTGGDLYFRLKGEAGWSSSKLGFDIEAGNNKYWVAAIPAGMFVATNEIEYYLYVTYNDHDDTYLGTTNGAVSIPFATEADAQANPFSFIYGGASGDEAGFIWHAGNVVKVGETSAQFWTKIGYAQGTGSNRWVSDSVIYYTTNGTDPSITGHGMAGNADTFVQALGFDHMEEDAYEGGDAMWWMGTITNLPTGDGSSVRYKIGSWNTAGNNVERFAEYNTQEGGVDQVFVYSLYVAGADGLQVNGVNADYTTTKFFINEINGETAQIVVHYKPVGAPNVKNVQLYSNLGRRDYVDVDYTNAYITADGYADGICPPDGNLISTNDTGAYYIAIPLVGGPTDYYWTGTVSRCGAYRMTARHQTDTETNPTNWIWYSSGGLRDHAIVISPTKVHEMTLYELNALTVNASSSTEGGRSTFTSLTNASNGKFNLDWLNYIQANCLWFQPIHPSAETSRGDTSESIPGSPYATRNYFAVSGYFGDAGTEEDALNEFTNFVIACDSYTGSVGTINIMLDGVFNHTAWDAQMGAGGVELGYCGDPSASMGATMPGWYSLWTDYGEPATYYSGVYSNDIATAPDRGDFGKWNDVAELYFGKYSALVRHNPEDNTNYKNEGDVYDFTGMSTDTKKLWKYFGYYADFWLRKTGHAGTNAWVSILDNKGLDGLRCDFGQGLPPQFWEYFINHTRKMKWNFVFMAETLDGGIPGYRSNRHFDILNEDLVFKFTQAHISQTWEFKDAYEQRRNAYRGGSVLLNLTGHDEVMPESDAWMTASRYGCNAMIDGLPMLFYGQEKGIQPSSGEVGGTDQGFAKFELNFGKYIVNFKQWNKATFWESAPANSSGMDQWYGRVNWARLNSPALRSMNRYFLNTTGGGDNSRILAAAKYETYGAGPTNNDVVLAFALILDGSHTPASDTYDLKGPWGALGLDTGKWYQVRNIASSEAFSNVWTSSRSGQDLWDNGIWVNLPADSGQSITADGSLVQYLRLVEVPSGGATSHGTPYSWLESYGLGPDYEAADQLDQDSDGLLTWQEYIAGTSPIDAASCLVTEGSVNTGVNGNIIQWTATEEVGRVYAIYWTTNLLTPFSALVTNLPASMNSYTDTTHEVNQTIYYRINVQHNE